MKETKHNRKMLWPAFLILLVILSLLRLWVMMHTDLWIISGNDYDDTVQAKQAMYLLDGAWRGEYNNTTLIKGISYPLFLALCAKTGISYSLGLFMLMAAGCLLAAFSVRKIVNRYVCGLIYLVFLFAPMGFQESSYRVYRIATSAWLVLIIIAGLIGFFLRTEEKIIWQVLWIAAVSVALAVFWYNREDSLWILPFTAAALVLSCIRAFLLKRKKTEIPWKTRIIKFSVTCVLALMPLAAVTAAGKFQERKNFEAYGISVVNDRTEGNFSRLMGDLYRIEDDTNADSDVWITRAMVAKAEAASPTLASLRDNISSSFFSWSGGSDVTEMKGDMVQWVMRTALSDAGYYKSAAKADTFCRKAADELDAAFEDGSLKKSDKIFLSTQIRGFSANEFPQLIAASMNDLAAELTYRYSGVPFPIYPSYGAGDTDGEVVRRIADLVSYRIPEDDDPAWMVSLRSRAADISNGFAGVFRVSGKAVFFIAAAAWLYLLADGAIRNRKKNNGCGVTCLILAGFFLTGYLNVFMVSTFSVWLHSPGTDNIYLSGSIPFFLGFELGSIIMAVRYCLAKRF